jgi:hypothetical protein
VLCSCRRYIGRHPQFIASMADVCDIVTYTAHCCLGHICNRKWKRLGRFTSINAAREEIVRHLMVSGKHYMPEDEAIRLSQQCSVIGSDRCCIQEVFEGPLHAVVPSISKNVRKRTRSRDLSRASSSHSILMPPAVVVDSVEYPVRLAQYIAEDASVLDHSINVLESIADGIAVYGGDTTFADVPALLTHLTDYPLALRDHVEQLRHVVLHMRSYNI